MASQVEMKGSHWNLFEHLCSRFASKGQSPEVSQWELIAETLAHCNLDPCQAGRPVPDKEAGKRSCTVSFFPEAFQETGFRKVHPGGTKLRADLTEDHERLSHLFKSYL